MSLLEMLQSRGFTPRKTSMNHGGEYCSPCPGPACNGTGVDRFHIWPDRAAGGKLPGKFWCRQCGISGDTIAFLQIVDGLTFPQACSELGILLDHGHLPTKSRFQPAPTTHRSEFTWTPKTYDEPGLVWQEKATNLLLDCQERLRSDNEAMAWLARRGIDADMVSAYGLGYNRSSKGGDRYRPRERWGLPKKMQGGKDKRLWIPQGWVIPAYNPQGALVQLRIRRRNEDVNAFASEIKYLPIDGSSMATMVLHRDAEVFVVVECGFDAILLAALTGGKIGAITTWNSAARPDTDTHALLKQATCILGGLDYDQGGDREQAWWSGKYRQYRRLPPLPCGLKDPGDAAAAGVDLWSWLKDGLPRGLQIKLGFVSRHKAVSVAQGAPQQPALDLAEPETDHQESDSEVIEIELVGGQIVHITNDPDTWRQLVADGKCAFSQNELERLHIALDGLAGDERNEAIQAAIESKMIFGGYIHAGRCGMEG